VLAGWVGTVLAFYFSAASQERTLDKVIGQTGGGAGPSMLVSEKMIAPSSIAGLQKLHETKPEDISIADLQGEFAKQLPNGARVTRLVFEQNGVFKYILHVGTLDAFVVKRQKAGDTTDVIAKKTFADMLVDNETLRQISQLVVFVSTATTLGDAKTALDKVMGAQDIIVTATGNAAEPMLGWLSNVDLTKALTVT
jgi:hypothetical protein